MYGYAATTAREESVATSPPAVVRPTEPGRPRPDRRTRMGAVSLLLGVVVVASVSGLGDGGRRGATLVGHEVVRARRSSTRPARRATGAAVKVSIR